MWWTEKGFVDINFVSFWCTLFIERQLTHTQIHLMILMKDWVVLRGDTDIYLIPVRKRERQRQRQIEGEREQSTEKKKEDIRYFDDSKRFQIWYVHDRRFPSPFALKLYRVKKGV